MAKFEIDGKHEVHVRYTVEADTFDEALGKLCDIEIWTEYCGEPATFGVNEYACESNGIEFKVVDSWPDPSPTGDWHYPNRRWEWGSPEEEEVQACR
jgi:hypothetical protein